jgi:2-oxoglutarate dehydrogenase E1 component
VEEIRAVAATYPNLQEIVWVQEEPRNMGAWTYVAPRLVDALDLPLRYEGRPERASPAEGYQHRHQQEQNRIVFAALGDAPQVGPPARGGEKLIGKRK